MASFPEPNDRSFRERRDDLSHSDEEPEEKEISAVFHVGTWYCALCGASLVVHPSMDGKRYLQHTKGMFIDCPLAGRVFHDPGTKLEIVDLKQEER